MTRRGSARKAGEDGETGWTCKMCKIKFTDEKSEILECEYCEQHFCRKCVNLSSSEYKFLTKRSDMHWYCPPCEDKAMRNLKIEKEVETRCNEYFAKVESRLNNLESKVEQKVNVEQVKDIIKEMGINDATENDASNKVSTDEMNEHINELRESNARKCNIIAYNLTESKAVEAENRRNDDLAMMEKLCEIMETNPEGIQNTTRLGKVVKDGNNVKPRPLKVVFTSEREKTQFMRHLRNLATADEEYKSVSIVHDMTLRERELNKEKLTEAKELNEKNGSGDFKYIVTGPPWGRKVAKVKKQ